MKIIINYEHGTLILKNLTAEIATQFHFLQWDQRALFYRCHAFYYRNLILYFHDQQIVYDDQVKEYKHLALNFHTNFTPRDFQEQALRQWRSSRYGIVVLPTGSGKSFLAALAIQKIQRSTIIITPTIDLMLQWQRNLTEHFQLPIGSIGGGNYDVQSITVTTYESAKIHADHLGNYFCFIVFDECHHLPTPIYAQMARSYIAPYRLGLTATPDQEEYRQSISNEILGPIIFQQEINDLSGEHLAPYQIESIPITLTKKEQLDYDQYRQQYLDYRQKIFPEGSYFTWENFVIRASQTLEGRKALQAFYTHKSIANNAQNKLQQLIQILIKHRKEQILIFTNDNEAAYHLSRQLFLPLITHETKAKERKLILENFRQGVWPYLINSRVLNEGVDVPEASIAVIYSGTSTVREHVQRLGRILRKQENKQAILYELITKNTTEVHTSKRRRDHAAYNNAL